jgi:hypothetical protein
LRPVGHLNRAIETVGVHEIETGARGVHIGDDRERHVVEPDIFPQRGAAVGSLGEQAPVKIVEVMRRGRGAREAADRHALKRVVGVAGGDR